MKLIKPIQAAIKNPLLGDTANDTINSEGGGETYVNNTIQAIITIFLVVAVIYFVWHFVMSAYHMISSNGDPKKYEEAQKSILYSLVGIILVFSVFGILKFAGILFGITSLADLSITWPTLTLSN
jgi:hypothetical protein